MRHDEIGACGDRLVDAGDRIVDVEIEFAQRRLVMGQALRGGSGEPVAAAVVQHARSPLFFFLRSSFF